MGHITEGVRVDTFEIRDEEINVEEIMQRIRDNIKRRKESGEYHEDQKLIYEQAENYEYLYGWHDVEDWNGTPTRWMSDDAILVIHSDSAKNAELSFQATSYIHPRSLKVSDGNRQDILQIVPNAFTPIKVPISLKEGSNIILLKVPEGGDRPCDTSMEDSVDGRCLSIAVQGIATAAQSGLEVVKSHLATNPVIRPMDFTLEVVDAGNMNKHLHGINSIWDIENNSYNISSHRSVTGRFLVKGRELVNGEVRRYVDPIIWKQTEFNHGVVNSLNDAFQKIDILTKMLIERDNVNGEAKREIETNANHSIEIDKAEIAKQIEHNIEEKIKINIADVYAKTNDSISNIRFEIRNDIAKCVNQAKIEAIGETESCIDNAKKEVSQNTANALGHIRSEISGQIQDRIEQAKPEIVKDIAGNIENLRSEMDRRIDEHLNNPVASLKDYPDKRISLAGMLERWMEKIMHLPVSLESNDLGINYFVFEEKFRGSSEEIKQRQSAFLEYFKGCKKVLDIGCGRGEFLELLQENSIEAQGVDMDEDMVNYCASKGLKVKRTDAVSFLEKQVDGSLDGIFLDQVVEHLESAYLVKMLELCYKKLNNGCNIVIETVNPLSLTSLANFYVDMTHKRPMHPETLKFLLGYMAFREIETRFSSPLPEKMRLKKVGVDARDGKNSILAETLNQNNEMLNQVLFGAQDYMVTGKK
jgi:2-polyprenyl-3-methyl-5-hydroxy-6-metoxy-1,4-benzoquinol methylase